MALAAIFLCGKNSAQAFYTGLAVATSSRGRYSCGAGAIDAAILTMLIHAAGH